MYLLGIVSYLYRQVKVKFRGNLESIQPIPELKYREFSYATGALTFDGFSASSWTLSTSDGVPKTYYIPAAEKQGGTAKRKKSFAAGVDGTGQCVAILTSGGDSQGNYA